MKIGIIADDYTGGTDAASFLVEQGLTCIQLSGIQHQDVPLVTDAIVVSLKSRTEPAEKAIADSLATYRWLKQQGCNIIQFKYCSTFDSTTQGNIGPVTDALLAEAELSATIVVPSLPVNGRDVFYGNLFVKGELLNESGMKDHPLTPMDDANLLRLMDKQSNGKSALIDYHIVEKGAVEVREAFDKQVGRGYQNIIIDAFTDQHLFTIGTAFAGYPFVTGASGLTQGLGRALIQQCKSATTRSHIPVPRRAKTVIISGSCSQQTNRQVAWYQPLANVWHIDPDKLGNIEHYSDEIVRWLEMLPPTDLAPLISATVNKDQLSAIREKYNFNVSARIETLFSLLVKKLQTRGYRNFISAGGETSGAITQALGVQELLIGKLICPGVPWVTSLSQDIYLALKSGNFGEDDFFVKAQQLIETERVL